MIYLPVPLIVASLEMKQFLHCLAASEAILKDFGKTNCHLTTIKHKTKPCAYFRDVQKIKLIPSEYDRYQVCIVCLNEDIGGRKAYINCNLICHIHLWC